MASDKVCLALREKYRFLREELFRDARRSGHPVNLEPARKPLSCPLGRPARGPWAGGPAMLASMDRMLVERSGLPAGSPVPAEKGLEILLAIHAYMFSHPVEKFTYQVSRRNGLEAIEALIAELRLSVPDISRRLTKLWSLSDLLEHCAPSSFLIAGRSARWGGKMSFLGAAAVGYIVGGNSAAMCCALLGFCFFCVWRTILVRWALWKEAKIVLGW